MRTRRLGPFTVSAISLGCMNISHAYGTPPPPEVGGRLLLEALDLGYTYFDSAALYGFGANETLIGDVLMPRRREFTFSSKGGLFRNEQGQRHVDGRADVIRQNCEESLARLRTDVIDLYYLHRWDKRVPIEDSVGTLSELVREGKVRAIGLCEVSAPTLRRAHAVHPIAAVQSEYSLWTRNPEVAVLQACKELGVAFVPFSPLGRGFLTGMLRDPSALPPKDIRHNMPRFQPEHFPLNLPLLDGLGEVAHAQGCTRGQLALAWLLAQGDHIIPIPGTTQLDHLRENAAAEAVTLSARVQAQLDTLVNTRTVSGARYNDATQKEIDTEEISAN
jgi:aryl-alcohol dehydrogenase-like predicted oxidoreductase